MATRDARLAEIDKLLAKMEETWKTYAATYLTPEEKEPAEVKSELAAMRSAPAPETTPAQSIILPSDGTPSLETSGFLHVHAAPLHADDEPFSLAEHEDVLDFRLLTRDRRQGMHKGDAPVPHVRAPVGGQRQPLTGPTFADRSLPDTVLAHVVALAGCRRAS